MRKDFFAQCVCFTFKLLRISDKGGREKCVIVEAFLPLRMLWALSWGNKKEKGVAHWATPFEYGGPARA